MYIPAHFAQRDLAALHEAIERYSFATLVSGASAELTASHLPLLLDRSDSAQSTLLGHMARANSQWRDAADQDVLAIFSGPHAYISPSWYESTQVVPTWNYVAVHAYGRLELMEDRREIQLLLARMVALYEAGQPQPWRLNEADEFVDRMLKQIVAFRIPITRLEGKWKLNQNRPANQRQRVVNELSQRSDENSQAIAQLMRGFAVD
jgi:transcriptional regulator